MRDFKYIWVVGLIVTALIIIIPIVLLVITPEVSAGDDPWQSVPNRIPETDHTSLIEGPFESGREVTMRCLECHESAGEQMLHNVHWTWQSPGVEMEGRDELVSLGKRNTINNFCIGVQSNWQGCSRCHAGYGWAEQDYDFADYTGVDCLVCHDQSGGYVKGTAGEPVEGVDLVASAQSVGVPTRENCGGCHFNGGGGNGVKHGDLDESLYFPSENVDVHMGRYDFLCVDCHQTEDHVIGGRSLTVSVDNANQIACTDCHNGEIVHEDERITEHIDDVACQTCHIPAGATRDATKMHWDWSTAGRDDIPEDEHEYLRIKGSFVYARDFIPEYYWSNGTLEYRYLFGDTIDPEVPTVLNMPDGDINDPEAVIWPFKIHRANQPYDAIHNYLLQPKTVGEGGYWTDFDWDQAFILGSEATGLAYSGEYGFAPTEMYWSVTHMVTPSEHALQCTDCHGENATRMDWELLGYPGDPMIWGGRDSE